MISIIIPCFNDIALGFLEKNLELYRSLATQVEVICVDSGSSDGTVELIQRYDAKLISLASHSRGAKLNAGIAASTKAMVLLQHPRSSLTKEGVEYLINHSHESWGAFTHCFDHNHPLLKFTSYYSNYVRGRLSKIYYLDHCIFAQRSLLDAIGGVLEIDIFEDTVLCQELAAITPPVLLPFVSTTSSKRFLHNGLIKQSLLNQLLKITFHLQINHRWMNKLYEKGLSLNTKYRDKKPK